jgi:hypothetical protein
MFWLLTFPVHLDPARGVLWGSVLWAGVALSLTVEALWSTYGWLGSAAVAFTVGALLWHAPAVFDHIAWNPFFGLLFVVATAGLACVVVAGRTGWWPVMVFTASVAAQCHVFLAILAVALVVGAPTARLLIWGWPHRRRWAVAGFAVGLACWSAPLVQQVSGHRGNLVALFNSRGAHRALGLTFGLRNLAAAGSISPVWLHDAPMTFYTVGSFQFGPSPTYGVFIGCLLIAVALVALRTHRRSLAALAILAVSCAVAAVASFAVIPVSQYPSMVYLIYVLWVIGILIWVVIAWAVIEAARAAAHIRRVRLASGDQSRIPSRVHLHLTHAAFAPPVAATVAVILVGVLGLSGIARDGQLAVPHKTVSQAGPIALSIERLVPPGPVEVEFRSSNVSPYGAVLGAVWRLEADGWSPGLRSVLAAQETGLWADRLGRWPTVIVSFEGDSLASTVRTR